jgi:hypothetical protein
LYPIPAVRGLSRLLRNMSEGCWVQPRPVMTCLWANKTGCGEALWVPCSTPARAPGLPAAAALFSKLNPRMRRRIGAYSARPAGRPLLAKRNSIAVAPNACCYGWEGFFFPGKSKAYP